jgi:hypothetical protein
MGTRPNHRTSESKTIIEQGADQMQTNLRSDQLRTTATSTMPLYVGDGMRATGAEADFRASRLLAEAARDHAVQHGPGLRHRVGHAIIAIGRAIHGLEVEAPARPALDAS